jgi:hypothetical protein
MIDRRPALIARCRSVADVPAALEAGRSANVPIAVRGAGHNGPGFGTVEGGVVIDLSPMHSVDRGPRAAHGSLGALPEWQKCRYTGRVLGVSLRRRFDKGEREVRGVLPIAGYR